jgi:hypothetical protein
MNSEQDIEHLTLGPTLGEMVLGFDEERLLAFARSTAEAQKQSAIFEGLDLDADLLTEELLELFRGWRAER